jgi:hypothetical protein
MHIKGTQGSHLVNGVWVTPDGPPTEIPDADWPLYRALPGVVQVDPPAAPAAPTLKQLESELLNVAAEVQALAGATPGIAPA